MRRSVVRSHPRLPIRDADLAQWESTPLWTGICRFDSGRRCQYRFSSEVRAAGSNPARRGFESFSRCQLFWTFATQRVLTRRGSALEGLRLYGKPMMGAALTRRRRRISTPGCRSFFALSARLADRPDHGWQVTGALVSQAPSQRPTRPFEIARVCSRNQHVVPAPLSNKCLHSQEFAACRQRAILCIIAITRRDLHIIVKTAALRTLGIAFHIRLLCESRQRQQV